MATYDEMRGTAVLDKDGEKIGTLSDFYVDDETEQPSWITVKTGFFGSKSSFVPLAPARETEDGLVVPLTKDQVKDAPNVDADEEISQSDERELYQYYRSLFGEQQSDASTGSSASETGGSSDTVIRSEEEVQVNKRTEEAGRVRLKKYVVTENITFTVPVEREEVRLAQEPIPADEATQARGAKIGEEEQEVTLHEEQIEVDKKVVPKERLRLEKQAVQEEAQVDETVRKERIDVEGDGDRR